MTPPRPSSGTALLLLLPLQSLCQQVCGLECVQCEGEGEDAMCTKTPPEPKLCPDTMISCITIRTYTPGQEDTRSLRSVVRSCAPGDMGWDCETGRTERGHVAEVCHDTCNWDGCNHTSRPTLAMSTFLMLMVVCLWLAAVSNL